MKKALLIFWLLCSGNFANASRPATNWQCVASGLPSSTLSFDLNESFSRAVISNLKVNQNLVSEVPVEGIMLSATDENYQRSVLSDLDLNYGHVLKLKSASLTAVLAFSHAADISPYHLYFSSEGRVVANYKLHCWLAE